MKPAPYKPPAGFYSAQSSLCETFSLEKAIEESQGGVADFLCELQKSPFIPKLESSRAFQGLAKGLTILPGSISKELIEEIHICCDLFISGELIGIGGEGPKEWLRRPPCDADMLRIQQVGIAKFKEDYNGPLHGHLVGAYLKRLLQKTGEGILFFFSIFINRTLTHLKLEPGFLHLPESGRSLIRSILRSSPDRYEILKKIVAVGRYVIEKDQVESRFLSVVFGVNDLNGVIETIDPIRGVRRIEKWNVVWGVIVMNFEFFDEE
ncbi:hypothetical protein BC829DRAFT_380778 [Chytridium lagenaria]|nr:hypothetical protein BC829DRAFT_380778 [Chytridium lagenaria]